MTTRYYLDPSAWVKRHFEEPGTAAVVTLFHALGAGGGTAACCRLGLTEMVATIARQARGENLDAPSVDTLLDNVRADFAAFRVVELDGQ